MTKTKLGSSDAKPAEFTVAPLYTAVQVTDVQQSQVQVSDA